MRVISNIPLLVLTLASLLTPILGRQTPTSYCKCICFQNSTIIPLNSPPEQKPPVVDPSPDPDEDSSESTPRAASSVIFPRGPGDSSPFRRDDDTENGDGSNSDNKHHRTLTCADCNRAFCRDYNLPICKGATEEDIFTSCFQRDSVKDETVVLLFILMTASLLSWAVLKPWISKVRDSGSVSAYAPIISSGNSNGSRGARGGVSGGLLPRTEDSYQDQNSSTRNRGDSDSVARQGGLNS